MSALRGGDDPHGRRRFTHGLILAQVTFDCVLLFIAALLGTWFESLANQPTGFSAERLLALDTVAQPKRQAFIDRHHIARRRADGALKCM